MKMIAPEEREMNALEIRDLTKRYPEFTLDHVTLTLPMGRAIGLIGENGAGKSTTIKLVLGMLRKDEGSVRMLGKEVDDSLADIKEDIGVVLDEVGFPGCLTAAQVGKIMKHTFRRWDAGQYTRLLCKLSLPDNKPFKDFSRGICLASSRRRTMAIGVRCARCLSNSLKK